MATEPRWKSSDLLLLPDDGKRYEIIDGELYVQKQPSWEHQVVSVRVSAALLIWSDETAAGVVSIAPGVIFADDDDVAPDVVWVSAARLPHILQKDGKLHAAPDLAVEVLSPGAKNEQRDREAKRKLYSRRGVREYWIVDWRRQEIEVYRREAAALALVATWHADDTAASPLLPGFARPVASFFAGLPIEIAGEGEDE
jgi:Uma2 family endonuclease